MTDSARPAHLSIHDVAPQTLDRVEELLSRLEAWGHRRVLLLVIPGVPWKEADLVVLRKWVDRGHPLAGHGWVHRIERYGDWRHALHGWLFSRNVAEHLALDRNGARELVARCAAWFEEQRFSPPTHYVPPAWAMGRLTAEDMRELPFRTYETFRGVYDSDAERFVPGPLVGFEADTALRAAACRAFNAWNLRRSTDRGPLRIALHPHDLHLHLGEDVERCCRRLTTTADPAELVRGGNP